MACSPFVEALEPLKAAGLKVEIDGRFVLVTDDALDFSRDHNGLAGIRQFIQDTLDEYEELCLEMVSEHKKWDEATDPEVPEEAAAEPQQEEPVFNFVEHILNSLGRNAQPAADPPAREFAPAPPIKEHIADSAQLDLARELNGRYSAKEVAQALENDLQDRGGIPTPEGPEAYIRDMKEAVMSATIATVVETEFRVSGVGYVKGPFIRSFGEVEKAKGFARECVAAAASPKYAATIKVTPYTTRRAV